MTTNHSGSAWSRAAGRGGAGQAPYDAGRYPPQRPARRRLLKLAHWSALVLGPIVLLSLVAAAIVYVRLLHGPVSLKPFKEQIEASINADLVGVRAAIDDAVITLADDYTVELRLVDLRLSHPDGDLVASAPEAAVELDKSALLRFEAAPERVFLIEPRLALTSTAEGGFSLSMSDAQPADGAGGGRNPARVGPPRPGEPSSLSFHRLDMARLLAETSARARHGGAATSRLRQVGVRNATVSITYAGETSEIRVIEAAVDLAHVQRLSVISAKAAIQSEKGPWTLDVHSEETPGEKALKVKVGVRDMVPATLARIASAFGLLAMFDTPVSGQLALDLSSEGDLKTATLAMDVGRGFIRLPSLPDTPVLLDGGRLAMLYDATTRRLAVAPSTLDWGGSRMTLEGGLESDPAEAHDPQWQFVFRSIEGVLSAEEFGVAPIPIDGFEARGRIIPGEGLVQLAALSLKAGGGEVAINGEVISGQGTPSTRVEARVSPMPLATLKAMWPRAAAPTARTWVGKQVSEAHLKAASLKLLSGRFLDSGEASDAAGPLLGRERLSASIEIADLRMSPLPDGLPIEAPHALIRLENSSLEVTVASADIVAAPQVRLPLNGVRLTMVDVRHEAPIAELALKSQTTVPVLIETLNNSQYNLAGQGPLPIEGIDGKVDGELTLAMPLTGGASVVKAEGKARISDIKGRSKAHRLDLQGGKIDIDVSDIGVIAKGDMIVNGVPAKLQMHRILDAPSDMQPPIRISTTLDNADRTQFGLDVNHFVQGDIPVEVTISHKKEAPPAIHLRADLTNAEIRFSSLAWRKVPGRTASVEFDVETGDGDFTHLRNFRMVGDNIAVDGSLMVDGEREVREFSFPNVSINVVSRLALNGKMDAKRIWKIAVTGSTFDARDLFRSLLALNATPEAEIKALHPPAGYDITATFDTVLGHSDVSLRGYRATMSERGDTLVSIEAAGTLDGGKPIAVLLKPDGPRTLYAESTDAGQAFKLIGFYPNVQSGRLRLEVDLEGRGAAEKSGVLWVEDFRVLGDPVVSEVYSSVAGGGADEGRRARKQRVEREVFEFQRMRVPFSVGHGQFVLDDSYIRGPLLGASIRGKVDYNAGRLNLGGTYVPLQGINAAVCDIPLVGPIVAGFDCQGVFGITYAIQGPMTDPQVLVNPLSMFTPGILRGIMEMTSPNPQVQPLREQRRAPVEDRVRASSAPPAGKPSIGGLEGWSSETTPAGKKKKDSARN